MKKFISLFILFLCSACLKTEQSNANENTGNQAKQTQTTTASISPEQKINAQIVHVIVALCDNKYQGIVPVPAKIGNGQDPDNNLYWGAMYGVKTFMKKQPQWQLVQTIKTPAPGILESA